MTLDLDPLLQSAEGPRSLRDLVFPLELTLAVLAPHPDDFDAIALTLRHLQGQGHVLHVAVLTGGASGVDDGFEGVASDAGKADLREQEQRASCALFGLPATHLHFLRLWEAGGDEEADEARLATWIAGRAPDLLFLPHGNDSNRTHRRTYETVRAIVARQRRATWALLQQDAKTLGMRVDLFFPFDAAAAQWKAALLRCHRSQQARNLRTRGSGFDARILAVNQAAAADLGVDAPYAECFEARRLGAD